MWTRQQAVDYALSQLGQTDGGLYFKIAFGWRSQADWCAAFDSAIVVLGNLDCPYFPNTFAFDKRDLGTIGDRWVEPYDLQVGDFISFDFDGGGQYGGDDRYDEGGKNALKIVLAAAVVVLVAAIGFAVYRGTASNKPKKPGNMETVAAADGNAAEDVQAETAGSDQEQEQQQTDTQVQEPSGSSGVEAGSVATMSDRASDEQEEGSGEEEPAEAEPAEEEPYNFPQGTLSYNGHHYYIYDDVRTNWADALDRCKERGGYLAVIGDSEENEQLFSYMLSRGYEQAFFGLTDTVEEGSWTYLAGGTSDFRDWGCNSVGGWEPNDADDGEDFAELDIYMNEGHWNDAQFGRQAYTPEGKEYRDLYTYICEWDF